MSILDQIATHTLERITADKNIINPEEMKALAFGNPPADGELFYKAAAKPGMSFICEIKRASPSKGIIDPVFDYQSIAREYEAAGADCISCLTEPKWFQGSDDIFREIRRLVHIPMIRKEFIVDEYQIWQSKIMGANCVLLICALLDTETLGRYLAICNDLGLAALVETHDETEVESAISTGARMIGVNNRNLKDFSVNFENASRLRDMIPSNMIYVAESGVKSIDDVKELKKIGADAILVGEMLMRAKDKSALLRSMKEAAG